MTEGFFYEALDDVMVYGFTRSEDADVDAWAEALIAHIESTPPDKLFRVVMDVSAKQVSFTARARQRTVEIFTRYRKRQGRFAFLFSSRTAPYYSRIFFASLGRLNFGLNYFNDRQKAVDWLRQS